MCIFLYIFNGGYYTKHDIKHKYFFNQGEFFRLKSRTIRKFLEMFIQPNLAEEKQPYAMDYILQAESAA